MCSVFLFLNVCFCGVLIESVFLFFTKHTLYYSVWNLRKQLLVDVKQRWTSHFRHFALGVPVHPGTLHLPFFSAIIIQWAVASRDWNWSSRSFSPHTHQQLWNWDDLSCAPDSSLLHRPSVMYDLNVHTASFVPSV